MTGCGLVSLWAPEHSSTQQSQTLEQRRSPEKLGFSSHLVSPSIEDVCQSLDHFQCCEAQARGTGEWIWNTGHTNTESVQKTKRSLTPNFTYIKNECVERVHTFWFLCVLISDDISWTENIVAIIKKAQQRLHFLRVLRKHNLDSGLLLTFYRTSIKSQLAYCISVWYSSCTMADKERLQRVARTA
ncbi:hypothetical protein ACEWY4_007081 [Coilia grayii]|uniref:Alkylated DNA repair protein AlkB homologue 8 N-terminal domain-containing protein n=1 Tax=Coilia grayii TaxID=363190 RepID=A0ABD1KF98_9TELE